MFVSDISLWGVAVLCQRNRLSLTMPVIDWLEKAVAPPLVARVGISPAIAAGTLNLPANFPSRPGGPVDRSDHPCVGSDTSDVRQAHRCGQGSSSRMNRIDVTWRGHARMRYQRMRPGIVQVPAQCAPTTPETTSQPGFGLRSQLIEIDGS